MTKWNPTGVLATTSHRPMQQRKPIIYIAGPYTADTQWGVEQNIRNAESYVIPIAQLDAAPLCPHLQSRSKDGVLGYQFWCDATMALLQVSDAILLIPGWRKSSGSRAEMEEASRRKMPQFYDTDLTESNRVKDWVASWYAEQANEL